MTELKDMDDETLIKYSYVNVSILRIKVVKALQGDIKIPKDIAKDAGMRPNYVSKVLSELKGQGIVECINEEMRKGRLYRLTDVGEAVAEILE